MHYKAGEQVLLTVFSLDSTQSHSCSVEQVDGDAIELRVNLPKARRFKVPRDASALLAGRSDQHPHSVLIADTSRLPVIRCVVERLGTQRRSYARVCGCFPMRYRLLSRQEYVKAQEEYRSRASAAVGDGLASANSWEASARYMEEWMPEIRYLARSLAELHRRMDLVIDLLSPSGSSVGGPLKPTEVRISGTGIDFVAEEELPVGHYIELEMRLPVVLGETVVVLGRILRVKCTSGPEGEGPSFRVAVEFTAIGERERDIIVQYVFSRQREELRDKRLGVGAQENNGQTSLSS